MSLHQEEIGPIPEETVRVAKAVFRQGNLCLRLREVLGTMYENQTFADLFPKMGRPAQAPWRLALVCILQYVEDLSDRQAAEAVRARIDWKYLLGLDLSDEGFDFTLLTDFRARLLEGKAEARVFEQLVQRLSEQGWIKKRGMVRTDSTHVLAAVRRLNRLELLGEALRAALDALAQQAPEWLQAWVPPQWFERYSRRIEEWRLPSAKARQQELMNEIGQDGLLLLTQVGNAPQCQDFSRIREVEGLRRIWVQQFFWQEGRLCLRNKDDLPPAHLTLRSPYDWDAHYGHKRDMSWYGFKVHFTETCDENLPHLITHVVTTDATKTDMEQTREIHEALAAHDLLPQTHVVDAGYVDAAAILHSRVTYGIELLGPVSQNHQWQTKAGQGYDLSGFSIQWESQQAICPAGKKSVKWTEGTDQHGQANISIRFGLHECRQCPSRSLCTRSATAPRMLTIRPQAEFEILQATRMQQQMETFRQRYAVRAGIEGTHSQAVRSLGLRRTRYLGLKKTALDHQFTAAAINVLRLDAFLEERHPTKTRTSHFAALSSKKIS